MSNKVKIFLVIVLLIIAGAYGYSKMRKVTPGAVANNGNTGDFNPQQRREQIAEVAKEANITPEQQKKIDAVRAEVQKSGDWRQMRTAMQDILTTEQRTKIRQSMQSRMQQRDAKMKAAMSPDEYKRYQDKRRERFAGRGGRGGGRRGGDNGGQNAAPAGNNSANAS
jgi:Spy/CpxP family protein refolding chaperone